MSKRVVTVTINIDPTEYDGAEDTAQGAIDLVCDILRAESDFPPDEKLIVACDGLADAINTDAL
jgi:hypothetical protein